MHPIETADTHAQREASARVVHHRPAPVLQDPWKIVPLAAAIPTSALASAVVRADPPPTSSVISPEAAVISKRRWRSVWSRALPNRRSPIGNVSAGS
jgi:hypothetical protein